jgi:hypothetical protein
MYLKSGDLKGGVYALLHITPVRRNKKKVQFNHIY